MKSSGTFVLMLVALLVILPVSAFGLDPDNGLYGLDLETKTVVKEEVAVSVVDGETLAALAVEPKPSSHETSMTAMTLSVTTEHRSTQLEGGISVLPGGLVRY